MLARCGSDTPRRGVTFFELAVVMSVIAVLVALAVLAAQRLTIDTKLMRVREEHRVISRALQNYFVDNSGFPDESQGLTPLHQPITYLAALPPDIFARGDETSESYVYRTFEGTGQMTSWVLVCRGPDGDLDFDTRTGDSPDENLTAASAPPLPTTTDHLPETLVVLSYDPTNGLLSDGDVFMLSPFAAH